MRRLLIFLAVLLAVLGGVWIARVPIAQTVAEQLATSHAPLPVIFTIEEIDHTGLTVSGIQAGTNNPITVKRVQVHFTIDGLLSELIHRIDVQNVAIPITLQDNQLSVGDIVAGLEEEGSATVLPEWTVDAFSLQGFNSTISLPGIATLSLLADIETTNPLSSTFDHPDGFRQALRSIDLTGRLDLASDKGAASELGFSALKDVTATGSAEISMRSGQINLQTPEPLSLTSPHGTTTLSLSLSGDTETVDPKEITGTASIDMNLKGFAIPGANGAIASVALQGDMAVENGLITASVNDSSTLTLSSLPLESSLVPTDLAAVLQTVQISFKEEPQFQTSLSELLDGEPLSVTGSGTITADSGPFSFALQGPYQLQEAEGQIRADFAEARLDSDGFQYAGQTIRSTVVLRDGVVQPAAQSLGAGLFVDIEASKPDGISVHASAAGRTQADPTRLLWTLSRGGHIKIVSDDLTVDSEIKRTQINRIEYALTDQARVKPSIIDFARTTIDTGDTKARFDELETEIVFSPAETFFTIKAAPFLLDDKEMLAGPIELTASIKPQTNGTLVDGVITTEPGLAAKFHAYHTDRVPVIHTVTANLDVSPLTFSEGGLQPSELFPFLALSGPFHGLVDAKASLTVDPDKPPHGLITVSIQDAGFRNPVLALGNINKTIEIPIETLPGTRPEQQLSGTLSIGPLNQAPFSMTYAVRPDFGVAVKQLSIDGFGGNFGVKQLEIEPGGAEADGTLFLDAVDFQVLTEVADIEGFYAEGVLSGDIPFAVRDGRLVAPTGQLRALGSGRLTYTSPTLEAAALSDPQMELLVAALKDFRYTNLSLDLALPEDTDGSLLLNLQGSNPDVLNDHPFDINVNLESNFNKLANDLYNLYEQATDFAAEKTR